MTIIKSDLVTSRGLLLEDKNFIMSTILKGIYYGDSAFSHMKKQTFMKKYHPILESLLIKNALNVKIACLKEDVNVILGYVILDNDPSVLHWAFCKKSWRGIGIIKDLVPSTIKSVTHLTKTGLSIVKSKSYEYDPFLM